MSAEKSHEWLIDALYKEHDEQPDNPTSEELTASEERERSERVAAYEATLAELRDGLVMVAPRSEVSDSIRAAARKQAEVFAAELADKGVRPGRRAPSGTNPSTHSFWSRAKRQGALQLVAVLAVCLGAGLLVRTMSFGDRSMEAKFEAAPAAVEEEVAFGEGGAGSDNDDAFEAMPEAPEQKLAENSDFAPYDYDKREEVLAEPVEEGKKDVAVALRQDQKEANNEIEQLERQRRTNKKRSSSSKKSKGSSREVATRDSKDSLIDELWGTSRPSSAKAEAKPKSGKTYSDDGSLSVFGGSEDVAQEKAMAEAAPSTSGRGGSVGNNMDPAPSSPAPSIAPQEPSEELADAELPAKTTDKDVAVGGITTEKERAPATLAEAERAYKRNDYEQTVSDADAYLARGIGTNRERARAMELKAQALGKLGRNGEARALYEEIRETYPDYYRKENIRSKKKQRKAAPKKKMESYDSIESPGSLQSF